MSVKCLVVYFSAHLLMYFNTHTIYRFINPSKVIYRLLLRQIFQHFTTEDIDGYFGYHNKQRLFPLNVSNRLIFAREVTCVLLKVGTQVKYVLN
jgi:hypothetical protein